MAKYPKYKFAAVQAAPVYLDLDATVKKSVIPNNVAVTNAKAMFLLSLPLPYILSALLILFFK